MKTQGAMLSFAHYFNGNNQLKFDAWAQQSDRNIPPSAVENNVLANQKDAAIRMNLDFTKQFKRWIFKSKLFQSFETIDYQSLVTPLAHSFAESTILEQEFRKTINKKWVVSNGLQYKIEGARGPNYKSFYRRNTVALWSAFRTDISPKATFSGNLRIESIGQQAFPITAQVGFNYKLLKDASIKASLSKNYKAPTFNDLYWPQLGNPNLKPENAYTGNVTYHTFLPIDVSITHFQNYVNNWIEWAPYQGSLFRPRNILGVWSRGFELNLKQKSNFKTNNFLENQLSYSFIKTTYEKGIDANSLHKQLTYNPLHTMSLSHQVHFLEHFDARLEHIFTSKKYVTSDNLAALNPLLLGNISAQYSNVFKQKELIIVLKTNNIWNAPYQSIQYRPMPERRYLLSLNLKI
jgi:iron complex outermembrane receptor protein